MPYQPQKRFCYEYIYIYIYLYLIAYNWCKNGHFIFFFIIIFVANRYLLTYFLELLCRTPVNRCFWNSFLGIIQLLLSTSMEANFHIFLMYLVYRFFRFGIPSISLDMPSVLFPISLSLFEKPGITITNALYLVFRTKNLV